MKKLSFIAAAALLLGLLAGSATPALAGKGQGGPAPPGGNATLFGNPEPSAAYSYIRIQGCGYLNDRPVEVRIDHGAYTEAFAAWVWASGCIDMGFWTAEAGTYKLAGYQTVKRSQVLMGSGQMVVE